MGRAALLILSGSAGTALMSLLRNLVIARLIPVEDYGIAATFAMAMTVVEMASNIGLQQQIVQSRIGHDPAFQAGMQGFQLVRGLIAGAVLFFAAGWIAAFLGIPEVAWAYQVLALIPVMTGLQHFDHFRMQRRMRYLPHVLTRALPMAVSLALVWPICRIFPDYRAMLTALLVQVGLMLVVSHAVAEQRYRVSFDRDLIAGALRFGWPLLVNNVLLFLVLNGEKLIVGREIGMETLGLLAMGFTLTLTPTMVMARSVQSFFLPQLSAAQDDDARFQHLARTALTANFVNGVVLIVFFALLGEPLVLFLLGEKYAGLVPLIMLLAILNGVRVFKAGGAVVGLARAKTENAMAANMFRVLSLPASWWVAVTTGDLVPVLWIAIAGEAAGVVTSLALVRWRTGVALRPLVPAFLALAATLAAAALHATGLPQARELPGWTTALFCAVCGLVSIWTMGDIRTYVRRRTLVKFDE